MRNICVAKKKKKRDRKTEVIVEKSDPKFDPFTHRIQKTSAGVRINNGCILILKKLPLFDIG